MFIFLSTPTTAIFMFAYQKPATSLQNATLQPKPPLLSIKVQTPNGGETWVKGGIGIVTWTTVNVSQNVNGTLPEMTINGSNK